MRPGFNEFASARFVHGTLLKQDPTKIRFGLKGLQNKESSTLFDY